MVGFQSASKETEKRPNEERRPWAPFFFGVHEMQVAHPVRI
jgi:hypothetical protein